MGRYILFLLIISLTITTVSFAAVRRAHRWEGQLEMYRPKTPWPRCISHRTYRIPGNKVKGEVAMDGRTLFEMVMPAGGFRVEQRAEIVARRLERLFEMKAALEPVKVERWGKQWVVTLGGSIVLTAATGESQHFGLSRRELANRWADALRTTLTNALGPGAQNLRGHPPVEKIHVTLPPWDDRYKAILKGDRAYKRGDFNEAVVWYRRAVIEDRAAYDARYKLGKALARLGNLEDAKEELVASIQLRPEYQPARVALYRVDRALQRKK